MDKARSKPNYRRRVLRLPREQLAEAAQVNQTVRQ